MACGKEPLPGWGGLVILISLYRGDFGVLGGGSGVVVAIR